MEYYELDPLTGRYFKTALTAAPEEEQSDFVTGLKHGVKTTGATAAGAVGLVGATADMDGVRDVGLAGYQSVMDGMQAEQRDIYNIENAESLGDYVDAGQYWLGYAASNIATGLGIGSVGAAIAKRVARKHIEREVTKQIAERAARGEFMRETERVAAQRAATDKMAQEFARKGFIGGVAPQAFIQELGATYGEAKARADAEGRSIDEIDLGRVWGYGSLAGAAEFGTDLLTAGALRVGPLKDAVGRVTSSHPVAGRVQRGLVLSQAEGGTEVLQTGLEEMGAGASFEEANFSDPTSYFAGAVGGGAAGLVMGNGQRDLLQKGQERGKPELEQQLDMFGEVPGPVQPPVEDYQYDPRTFVGPDRDYTQMELGALDPRRDQEDDMFAAQRADQVGMESRAFERFQAQSADGRAQRNAQDFLYDAGMSRLQQERQSPEWHENQPTPDPAVIEGVITEDNIDHAMAAAEAATGKKVQPYVRKWAVDTLVGKPVEAVRTKKVKGVNQIAVMDAIRSMAPAVDGPAQPMEASIGAAEAELRQYAADNLGPTWEEDNANLSQLIAERKYKKFTAEVGKLIKEQAASIESSSQPILNKFISLREEMKGAPKEEIEAARRRVFDALPPEQQRAITDEVAASISKRNPKRAEAIRSGQRPLIMREVAFHLGMGKVNSALGGVQKTVSNMRAGEAGMTLKPVSLRRLAKDADREERAPTVEAENNLPTIPEVAAARAARAARSVVDAAVAALKDMKPTGKNQKKVVDTLKRAIQTGDTGALLDTKGQLSQTLLAIASGITTKTKGRERQAAKTAIDQVRKKVSDATGVSLESLLDNLRTTALVTDGVNDMSPGEVVADDAEGFFNDSMESPVTGSEDFNVEDLYGSDRVQQTMGSIKTIGGSQAQTESSRKRLSAKDLQADADAAAENQAAHEASLQKILDAAAPRMHIYSQLWDDNKSTGVLEFDALTNDDKVKWINTANAVAYGELPQTAMEEEALALEQRELESMSDVSTQEMNSDRSIGRTEEGQQNAPDDTGDAGEWRSGNTGTNRPTITVKKRPGKRFSKSDERGPTATRESLEDIVESLTGKRSNWRVHVYDSAEDAVAAGRIRSEEAGDTQGWVERRGGFLHANFIAGHIPAGNEMAVFLHEVGEHIGIENLLGRDDYTRLITKIGVWAEANDGTTESRVAAKAKQRAEANTQNESDYAPELIAYFIEEAVKAGVNPQAAQYKSEFERWVRRIWSAFKAALRKLRITNVNDLTAQHIVDLAYGAARLELAGKWHGDSKHGSANPTFNRVIFNDKNIITVGRHEGGDTAPGTLKYSKDNGYDVEIIDDPSTIEGLDELLAAMAPDPNDRRANQRTKDRFLSSVPEGTRFYSDETATQRATRKASDASRERLGGSATRTTAFPGKFGPFSGGSVAGQFVGTGVRQALYIKLYGNEQLVAGVTDSPAQTIILNADGEITINGPAYGSKAYTWMKERGWVTDAWGLDSDETSDDGAVWTRLEGVKRRELITLIGEAHARSLNWPDKTGVPLNRTGLYWTRATGATGGIDGHSAAIYFSKVDTSGSLYEPPTTQAAKELASTIKHHYRGIVDKYGPSLLSLHALHDMYGKTLTKLQDFYHHMSQMEKEQVTRQSDGHKIATQWSNLKDDAKRSLHALMSEATKWQIHPDVPFDHENNKHLKDNEAAEAKHAELAKRWSELGEPAQKVYVAARDHLIQTWKDRGEIYKTLVKHSFDPKIKVTTDPDEKARLIEERDQYINEHAKQLKNLKGPYFPLRRFGQHVVVFKSKAYQDLEKKLFVATGDTRRELEAEQLAMRKQKENYWVEAFESYAPAAQLADRTPGATHKYSYRIDTGQRDITQAGFKRVSDLLEAGMQAKGADTNAIRHVQAMLAEMYVDSLPENHALAQELRRQGIEGEHKDMLRSFASTVERDSFYLARLKYGQQLTEDLYELKNQAEDPKHQQVAEEVVKRHAMDLEFKHTPIQNALARASGIYHLFSPSYWMVNATQPWFIGAPYLAARYGMGKSLSALRTGFVDAGGLVKKMVKRDGLFTTLDVSSIQDPQEREMLEYLIDKGRIDINITHDLGVMAKGGTSKLAKLSHLTMWPAHQVETVNRVMVALAAYRMARQGGARSGPMSHTDATAFADKTVVDTQVDYSNVNATRLMKHNGFPFGKLVFQFRKYQHAMVQLLFLNAKKAFEGDQHAKATLAYMFGTQFVTAGLVGLPLANVVGMIADGFLDDDDEDGDARTQMYNALVDNIGKDMADLVVKGVPAAVIGTDLTKRTGMGDLFSLLPFLRTDGNTGHDQLGDFLVASAGAPMSMITGALDAVKFADDGQWLRAVEATMPKAVKDVFKAARYGTEGVTTRSRNTEVDADVFSGWDIAQRALGLTSLKESDYWDTKQAVRKVDTAIQAEKSRLRREYAIARVNGDHREAAAIQRDIDAFNRKHWQHRLRSKDLTSEVKKRRKVAFAGGYNLGQPAEKLEGMIRLE